MSSRFVTIHTLLLSVLHLLVDGVCACGLMVLSDRIVSDFEACGMIVLYDILAFGTQPLTGRWVDSGGCRPQVLKRSLALLACGTLVCLMPFIANILTAMAAAFLLGMGNSLFHVYGGKYVAVSSRNDIRAMGVFVSTGAVGLALGLGFGNAVLLTSFLLMLLLSSALHLHLVASAQRVVSGNLGVSTTIVTSGKPVPPNEAGRTIPLLFLFCLMLVVSGRAFIGESVPSLRSILPSMGAPLTMVVVSIIVMAGKAAGGFLSKLWGVGNVFCASMLLSAAVYLLCPWHDAFVIATLLLINISMPCTLYWATKAAPGREGWTFGLLAMALLPGYLFGYLSKNDAYSQALLMPLMATLLLESFLLLCLRERRWQVLAVSVVLNIFTNVPLNAFIMAYDITSPIFIIFLECVVVAVEFLGYSLVLHDRRRALRYSFLCNTFSALVGFFCQFLILNEWGCIP